MRQSRSAASFSVALKRLYRPIAGQDICHWRGQNDWQITPGNLTEGLTVFELKGGNLI
jgi:hypothetical protein